MSEIVERNKFTNYVYARLLGGASKEQEFDREIFEGITAELQRADKNHPDYTGGEIEIRRDGAVYKMLPKKNENVEARR